VNATVCRARVLEITEGDDATTTLAAFSVDDEATSLNQSTAHTTGYRYNNKCKKTAVYTQC